MNGLKKYIGSSEAPATTEDDVKWFCYDNGVELKEHRTLSKEKDESKWWWCHGYQANGPFKAMVDACWDCCERMGWVNKAAGWTNRRNNGYR